MRIAWKASWSSGANTVVSDVRFQRYKEYGIGLDTNPYHKKRADSKTEIRWNFDNFRPEYYDILGAFSFMHTSRIRKKG